MYVICAQLSGVHLLGHLDLNSQNLHRIGGRK